MDEHELKLFLEKNKKLIHSGNVKNVLFIYSITNFFSKGFNIFLNYSTKDTHCYQIKEISNQLGSYPEIDKVLYWEADSGEDIVKYMERALKMSRVFVLFRKLYQIQSSGG